MARRGIPRGKKESHLLSFSALYKTMDACTVTAAPTKEGNQRASYWLGLYEGPFALLCFADANLSVLCFSLQYGYMRTVLWKILRPVIIVAISNV